MFSIYIIILYGVLVALKPTRKVALALMPWLVFACSYDWMRLLPNYEVNPIDVRGLYEAERGLFGIAAASGGHLIPCEYFAAHHCALADVLARLDARYPSMDGLHPNKAGMTQLARLWLQCMQVQ